MDAFVKADSARMDFMRNLTRMVDRRTQEMGWEIRIRQGRVGGTEKDAGSRRRASMGASRLFVRGDLTALEALKMKTDHAAGGGAPRRREIHPEDVGVRLRDLGLGAIVGEKAEKAYEAVKRSPPSSTVTSVRRTSIGG